MEIVDKYKKEHQNKYLQSIWDTQTVYDETGVVIGEEGEMQFLLSPKKGRVVVRDIHLEKTYQEGKDYLLTPKGIKRIKDGGLPFFSVDDYSLKEKTGSIILELAPEKEK